MSATTSEFRLGQVCTTPAGIDCLQILQQSIQAQHSDDGQVRVSHVETGRQTVVLSLAKQQAAESARKLTASEVRNG